MVINATAPGKLILIGEYAVLEGAPALVTAVGRYAEVWFEPASGAELLIDAPSIEVRDAQALVSKEGVSWQQGGDALSMVTACAAAVAAHLGEAPSGGKLLIGSSDLMNDDGQKLGFGSSAAVATALCGAWLAAHGDASRREVFTVAHEAHSAAQGGVGSGIDIAASVFGGTLQFIRGERLPKVMPMGCLDEVAMICVAAGESTSTASMVMQVQKLQRDDPTEFATCMQELSVAAQEGVRAHAANDCDAFCAAISSYEQGLRRLGEKSGADIVSEAHRTIGDIVRAAGGVYKPSGAGGGDLGIAFVRAQSAAALERALDEAGLRRLPVAVGAAGLRLGA